MSGASWWATKVSECLIDERALSWLRRSQRAFVSWRLNGSRPLTPAPSSPPFIALRPRVARSSMSGASLSVMQARKALYDGQARMNHESWGSNG
jgi:hypothetical protein